MDKKLIRLTESDLHRIVKESVKRGVKEESMPSVSYPSNWDDEGYHYNQTIKIGLTQEDLDALNSKLTRMADSFDTPDEDGVISTNPMLNGHEMSFKYLRMPLQFGKNHLKLSQLYALAELLNWKEYKRVKMDRNTILLIVQI